MRTGLKCSLVTLSLSLAMVSGQALAGDQWPDTGQTICYDAAGTAITCTGADGVWGGQDADYDGPARDYDTSTEAGAVIDNVTMLQWDNNSTPPAERLTHTEALAFVASMNTASYLGHSDWRLPTINELSTLIDAGKLRWSIDDAFVMPIDDYFGNDIIVWSATASPANPAHHMVARFAQGIVNDGAANGTGGPAFPGPSTENEAFVRAVRDATTPTTPTTRFASDGTTVYDSLTGLEWQADKASSTNGAVEIGEKFAWGSGACVVGAANEQPDALCYCENLDLDGNTDWRLPDRNELQSIVDYSKTVDPDNGDFLIDDVFRASMPAVTFGTSYFWSSTNGSVYVTDHWEYTDAVATRFDRGFALPAITKSSNRFVRCVRGREFMVTVDDTDANLTADNSGVNPVIYEADFSVTYTATAGITSVIVANASYSSGACLADGSATTCTVPFTAVKAAHTVFATTSVLPTHQIAVSVGEGGNVTDETNGSAAVLDGESVTVIDGTSRTFAITANEHYEVDTVTTNAGEVTLAGGQYTFTNVTANDTLAATFMQNEFQLTVNPTGTGTGTVTSEPMGIDCNTGGTCSYYYAQDAEVTLTAVADSGSTFTGWEGSGCTGTATCTVTVDETKNVTASFDNPNAGSTSLLQMIVPVISKPKE